METLGAIASLFLGISLLGAGFMAGILVSAVKKETLENAGVAVEIAAPQLSNKEKVTKISGVPMRELRSQNFSPDDTIFWYGMHEWVVMDEFIIQRLRGTV